MSKAMLRVCRERGIGSLITELKLTVTQIYGSTINRLDFIGDSPAGLRGVNWSRVWAIGGERLYVLHLVKVPSRLTMSA